MRLALLVLLFSVFIQRSAAAPCTPKTPPDSPCTPSGAGAKSDKDEIIKLIKRANSQDARVQQMKDDYLAVRGKPGVDAAVELAACEAYLKAKAAQDQLYKDALEKTETLYHVAPDQKQLTIAPSSDPGLNYVQGLTAYWNPQVTDSGPDVLLVIKIRGSDNADHYGGAVMDPSDADGKPGLRALTFEDGRTVILRASFDQAVRTGNPGFLAHLLYHESRHFKQLSRPDLGPNRGWGTLEEDELEAYESSDKLTNVFGLTPKEAAGVHESLSTYQDKVDRGEFSSRADTPRRAALRKQYYETQQINLEEEYVELSAKVKLEKAAQADLQKRQEEERLQREREKAEQAARAQAEVREGLDASAARCGYELTDNKRWELTPYGRERVGGEIITGFKGNGIGNGNGAYHHFDSNYSAGIRMSDVRLALLIQRACDDMRIYPGSIAPPPAKACNDSAQDLYAKVTDAEADQRLGYLFGEPRLRSDCVATILANAGRVTNTASFNSLLEAYQRPLIKEQERRLKSEKRYREAEEAEERRKQREERAQPGNNQGPHQGPDIYEPGRRVDRLLRGQ